MRQSAIIRQDRADLIRRARRMTPEERLEAFVRHTKLINQVYEAGVKYRASRLTSSKRKRSPVR